MEGALGRSGGPGGWRSQERKVGLTSGIFAPKLVLLFTMKKKPVKLPFRRGKHKKKSFETQ